MLKRKPLDIQLHHERWLVSYADFVTLLFAFFVVMYAMAKGNDQQHQRLSESLQALFSMDTAIEKSTLVEPLSLLPDQAQSSDSSLDQDNDSPMVDALPVLADRFRDSLAELINEEAIQVTGNESWLKITLNNHVLFLPGQATPSEQAKNIVEDIAPILRTIGNPIQVEGFTDNQVINTIKFPDNWELSTARAVAVVKLLIDNQISPQRLSATGYGEFQPVADNSTAEGRAQNRRVVLMVGKQPRHQPSVTSPPAVLPTPAANSPLSPVTLKNGEQLFTSDPDVLEIRQ